MSTCKPDKMILGQGYMVSSDCLKTGLNNNVLVVGSSGSGKTLSYLEAQLLETYERNLFINITKENLVSHYSTLFTKRGYKVNVMNFIHPEKSTAAYDLLHYIHSSTDVLYLAQTIIKADTDKMKSGNLSDPFWDESAIQLLCALIGYALTQCKNATFASVVRMFQRLNIHEDTEGISTSLDSAFRKLEETNPGCYAINCWKSFCQMPFKTAACIYGTLSPMINEIFTPEICSMMEMKNKLDFIKYASGKNVVFILSSPVNTAMHSLVNMFNAQAYKELYEYAECCTDHHLPIPVHFIYDDFATGGIIRNFEQYISIFREKNISVSILLQSESQLIAMYGESSAVTIINNCDTYCYFSSMDTRTAGSISEKMDIPVDQVLAMPVGIEYVFRRGQRPVITRRYEITHRNDWLDLHDKQDINIKS